MASLCSQRRSNIACGHILQDQRAIKRYLRLLASAANRHSSWLHETNGASCQDGLRTWTRSITETNRIRT
jgi:hypothetical protein